MKFVKLPFPLRMIHLFGLVTRFRQKELQEEWLHNLCLNEAEDKDKVPLIKEAVSEIDLDCDNYATEQSKFINRILDNIEG